MISLLLNLLIIKKKKNENINYTSIEERSEKWHCYALQFHLIFVDIFKYEI